MRRATLTRVKGGAALRTDSIEGECEAPVVGESFYMVSEPLTVGADFRYLETSPVTAVYTGPETRFATKSGSIYLLRYGGAP